MPDFPLPISPVPLSTVSLRLAGEVGQAALDWTGASGAGGTADLDQHIAAVKAALAGREQAAVTGARRAGVAAGVARRPGTTGNSGRGAIPGTGHGAAPAGTGRSATPGPGSQELNCPDVPFVADALAAEGVVPLRLLLHYACGFIEAVVGADWWPGESDCDTPDWESMRLAAVCHLISRAEAAAELHPDLGATA